MLLCVELCCCGERRKLWGGVGGRKGAGGLCFLLRARRGCRCGGGDGLDACGFGLSCYFCLLGLGDWCFVCQHSGLSRRMMEGLCDT